MLFLMNDVVLDLDAKLTSPPMNVRRFSAVSLDYVMRLGAEAFAVEPRLQHTNPEKAQRLGMLIMAKAPEVNAALFVAPAEFCKPAEVMRRYANLSIDVMADLLNRQNGGMLDAVQADRRVWRRLAA